MKTRLIILLIFISGMFVSASNEKKYFKADARWTEYISNTYFTPPIYQYGQQFYLNGDTIIDNVNYSKIFQINNSYDYYVGALREADGKVYARLEDYGSEYEEFLLYDFTVEVGNRIYSNAKEGSLSLPDSIEVMRIEKIILENGEERKHFFLDFGMEWIEGIGSVNGLLHDAYWHLTNYSYTELVCFKQNNFQLYKNDTWCAKYDCCDIATGLSEHKQDKAFLSQNPIKDILHIKNVEGDILSITIINQLGQVLQTKTVHGTEHIEIDCSGYQSGIYFILLRMSNMQCMYKIIKT